MAKFRKRIRAYQIGGALPDLEFTSIRQPGVPLPIEEFGSLTGVLNERFDQGLQLVEDQLAAAAALQTAPFEEDRRRGELLRESAISNLENIQRQGDFENQITKARRLGSDFNRGAIPLLQRQQGFQQIVDELGKRNINAQTQSDIINEIKRRENETPSIITTEDGLTLNNFRPEAFQSLLAEDVDIAEKLDKLGRGFESDLRSSLSKLTQLKTTDGQSTGVPITISGQTQTVDPDEVEALLDSAIDSDREIQAYLQREHQLGRGEQAELEIENLKDGIADKYGFKRTKFQQGFLPGQGRAGSSGTDDMVEAIVRTNSTPAFKINNSGDYQDLVSTENEYLRSDDPKLRQVGENLKTSRLRFEEQALGKLSPKDRQIYAAFEDTGSSRINQLRTGLGNLGNLNVEEEKDIIDIYNSLNLGDNDRYNSNIKKLERIQEVLNSGENLINTSLNEVSPLSREYTSYSADAEGLGKAFTGRHNKLLNQDLDSQNFSVLSGFGADKGQSWKDKFKNDYLDNSDFDDYTNIRFEARNSNGLDLSGSPFSTVTVLGTNKDGREERIGEHNIKESNSEQAWKNREKLGRALEQDGELREALFIRQQTQSLPNGDRLGSAVARTNVAGMPNNSERTLDIGSHKLKVRKDEFGEVDLIAPNGQPIIAVDQNGNRYNFADDTQIMSYIFSKLNQQ